MNIDRCRCVCAILTLRLVEVESLCVYVRI